MCGVIIGAKILSHRLGKVAAVEVKPPANAPKIFFEHIIRNVLGALYRLNISRANSHRRCEAERPPGQIIDHLAPASLAAIFKQEIDLLSEAYFDLTGKKISPYFRPPEGTFSESNLKMIEELGYKTVFWSFAYADWDNNKQPSPDYAKKKILDNLHDGAVILLHPTSATNAAVLGEVIDSIRAMGYEFGTLDEITCQNNKS